MAYPIVMNAMEQNFFSEHDRSGGIDIEMVRMGVGLCPGCLNTRVVSRVSKYHNTRALRVHTDPRNE